MPVQMDSWMILKWRNAGRSNNRLYRFLDTSQRRAACKRFANGKRSTTKSRRSLQKVFKEAKEKFKTERGRAA